MFRGLLEAGRIRLPKSPILKAQLLGMRYTIDPKGRIRVVDPSDSPDHVDAVLIALAGDMNDGYFAYVEAEIERMTKAKDEPGKSRTEDMGFEMPSPFAANYRTLLAQMRALPRG